MTSLRKPSFVLIAALALQMGAVSIGSAQQTNASRPAAARQPSAQYSASQQRYHQAVQQNQVQQQLKQNQVEHQLTQNATQLSRRPASANNPVDRQTEMTLQAQDRAYDARQRAAVDRYDQASQPVIRKPVQKKPAKPAKHGR